MRDASVEVDWEVPVPNLAERNVNKADLKTVLESARKTKSCRRLSVRFGLTVGFLGRKKVKRVKDKEGGELGDTNVRGTESRKFQKK